MDGEAAPVLHHEALCHLPHPGERGVGSAGQVLDPPVVLRGVVLGLRGAGAVGRLGLRAGGGAAACARAARLAGRRQGVVLLPPLPGLELGLPAGQAGGAPGALQLEGG